MAKIGLLLIAFIALWGPVTFQRGCKDLGGSLTHLAYFDKRDMRSTVVIVPQKRYLMGPDSLSVPVTGRERDLAGQVAGRGDIAHGGRDGAQRPGHGSCHGIADDRRQKDGDDQCADEARPNG